MAEHIEWEQLSPEDKKKQLFLRQKNTLNLFLERNAISKDQYDKRGYTGINITNGEMKLLFNLPPDRNPEPGFEVLKEGTIQTTAKARLITIEEYDEFVTEDGPAKWLIENLDKNEGY